MAARRLVVLGAALLAGIAAAGWVLALDLTGALGAVIVGGLVTSLAGRGVRSALDRVVPIGPRVDPEELARVLEASAAEDAEAEGFEWIDRLRGGDAGLAEPNWADDGRTERVDWTEWVDDSPPPAASTRVQARTAAPSTVAPEPAPAVSEPVVLESPPVERSVAPAPRPTPAADGWPAAPWDDPPPSPPLRSVS